jgi:hypothetical protein
MKVYLDSGEQYPAYFFSSDPRPGYKEFDIPKEQYDKWTKASEEYGICEDEIAHLLGDD